jgi:hypothetical protein
LRRNGSAESKQSCMWRTFEPRPWTLRIVALRNSQVRAQFFQDGERRISRLYFCWSEILWATKIQTPSGPSSAGRLGSCTTVAKPLPLSRLGLPLSEKQIPQVVENPESGGKSTEALERAFMRPRQVRYQAALRPDFLDSTACRRPSLQFFPHRPQ